MKKYGWYGLFAVLLVACGKDATGPSGPPDLTMKDVVGCWKYNQGCEFKCFDRGGGYYYLRNGNSGTYEWLGVYHLLGFRIYDSVLIKGPSGVDRMNRGDLPYRIDGNELVDLNTDGTMSSFRYSRVIPDSMVCATPWTYFSKPAGWDTLIRPFP